MNKKRLSAIFIILILVTLTLLALTKINFKPIVSYKNKFYTGENENWSVLLEVRDKQLDIEVTPKNLIDADTEIKLKIKTGPEYSSSGTLTYGNTQKSFRASVPLIVDPINYKDELVVISYNNNENKITLKSLK